MSDSAEPDLSEFHEAKPIAKFHRYFISGDGQVMFGLLGFDGKNNYFTASPEVMGSLAIEFKNLGAAGQRAKNGDPSKMVELGFATNVVYTLIPKGGGSNGAIEFQFVTPESMIFKTLIGPQLAAQMTSSLLHVLSTMASPPALHEFSELHSKLSGNPHEGEGTEVHFGQGYNSKILTILGLLVIRANLLELSMARLLAALMDITTARAEAIFFSSQNMKARTDMLRAAAGTSCLTSIQIDSVLKDIDHVDKISRRRNQLIHGEWSFSGNKFSVKERKPVGNTRVQDVIETFKSVESIVTDFHDTTVSVDITTRSILASRSIAS